MTILGEYSVYDNKGNKVGSVHEENNPGSGCGFTAILIIFTLLGSVLIWPALLSMIFSQDTPDADRVMYILCLVILVVNMWIHGKRISERDEHTFLDTWGELVLSGSFISGGIIGVLALLTGNGGASLLLGPVLGFLMSVGAALVTACIVNMG